MLDQILTDLDKRRLRLKAARELVDRATYAGERDNALAIAHRTSSRIREIERDLPTVAGTITIPARAGFGRIRLRLACLLIRRLDGWVSTLAEQATFKHGDVALTWTARADRAARIRELLPEFLAEVDQAALAAARTHRAYLRTLGEEHHTEADRENLVRAYRMSFLDHYGSSLIARITLGISAPGLPEEIEPGRYAAFDAMTAAHRADLPRLHLGGARRVIEIPAAP
ncbi:hypothetical protein [Nonomuraea sp. NPDC003214]